MQGIAQTYCCTWENKIVEEKILGSYSELVEQVEDEVPLGDHDPESGFRNRFLHRGSCPFSTFGSQFGLVCTK